MSAWRGALASQATGFAPDLNPATAVVLQGSLAQADVTAAVNDAVLNRTITGASTLTLTLRDPTRSLLRSSLFASRVGLTVVGMPFVLVAVAKSGNAQTLTFEDWIVDKMRHTSPPGTVAGTQANAFASSLGSMTRTAFAAKIWQVVWGTQATSFKVANASSGAATGKALVYADRHNAAPPLYLWPDAAPLREVLTWGTTQNPTEDAWTCLTRLANEVQWRCFSDGHALWFGPDSWLLERPVAATLVEHVGGVGDIDFTWDTGQAAATAQSTIVTDAVSFPPGAPVQLAGMGIATGTWLVSAMNRSLYIPDATVSFVQAQPSLPENYATSGPTLVTNVDGTVLGQSSTAASLAATDAVAFALAQVGKPYQYGATGPAAYDCSGLVYAAYQSVGIAIPRTSEAQWSALPHELLSNLLPGDLIFYNNGEGGVPGPGHVVMYVGAGKVVEAAAPGIPVHVVPIYGGAVGAARPAP